MTKHEDDETTIAGIVERYRAGFAAMDPEMPHHDLGSTPPRHRLHRAGDRRPDPGLEAVAAYYRGLRSANPADRVIEMGVDDLSIDVVGDVTSAFYRSHFVGEIEARPPERFVADGRVTFVLHRRRRDWEVIHYHESASPQFT